MLRVKVTLFSDRDATLRITSLYCTWGKQMLLINRSPRLKSVPGMNKFIYTVFFSLIKSTSSLFWGRKKEKYEMIRLDAKIHFDLWVLFELLRFLKVTMG